MDPPHPAHFCNLIRIAKKYDSLKVVLLDSPKRDFPIDYCLQVLQEIFTEIPLKIEFIVNTTHFAEISREELDSYGCDVYVGGNLKVLRRIESLGFPIKFIERAYDYTASDYKRPE